MCQVLAGRLVHDMYEYSNTRCLLALAFICEVSKLGKVPGAKNDFELY